MKLERDFYLCDAVELAQKLLGKTLVHATKEGITKGIIVETEAYMGKDDAAAHSYKTSSRTNIQYGEGGYTYIYLIYGMYNCFNIVANRQGIPHCVLIRALEPVGGIEIMKNRRRTEKVKNLCSGPGKLCMAMGITREQFGYDLCGEQLFLEPSAANNFEFVATPRKNIDYAGEAKDYLWRYIIKENPFISK